jgi:hypothetical protein
MTIEEGLLTYLNTECTFAVYPVKFPEDVVLPAGRLQRISGAPIISHSGDSGEERGRFQVSCFAATYLEAKGMAEEVKDALSAYKGVMGGLSRATSFILNETDLYEAEYGLHHIALDVDVIANVT